MITENDRLKDIKKDPAAAARLEAFSSIPIFHKLFGVMGGFRFGTLKKWNLPILGDLLPFVNGEPNVFPQGHPRRQPLWDGRPPLDSGGEPPYFVSYLLEKEAPAVLLVPGGAYNSVVMDAEGRDLAKLFNQKGFHAFIVRYRVSPDRYPASHLDLIRAMQLMRTNAQAWHIIPNKIIMAGFSAGGHLAASLPGLYPELAGQTGELAHVDALPNGMILGYPLINLDYKFMGFSLGLFLLGAKHDPALRTKLSAHRLANASFPPTYLFSVDHDPLVNLEQNGLLMKAALEQSHVPVKTHIFPGNEHGSGAVPPEQWIDEALAFVLEQMEKPQKAPSLSQQ